MCWSGSVTCRVLRAFLRPPWRAVPTCESSIGGACGLLSHPVRGRRSVLDVPETTAVTWGVLPEGCLDRVMICSPHFDDAALGAAYLLLAHPGSIVVTVYGGRPAAYPETPTEWDALGGFGPGD